MEMELKKILKGEHRGYICEVDGEIITFESTDGEHTHCTGLAEVLQSYINFELCDDIDELLEKTKCVLGSI